MELCSTEVESFVLIESSNSVDFALQFGKAWNRIFVGREFRNTFALIRDSGLCLSVKKSLQRINPSFCSNQLYKSFGLIAGNFSSRNKIKFKHCFVSAQVFGLPSSTGPLGFSNKVCDNNKLFSQHLNSNAKKSFKDKKFFKIKTFCLIFFRLLITQGKTKKAKQICDKIAHNNKRHLADDTWIKLKNEIQTQHVMVCLVI